MAKNGRKMAENDRKQRKKRQERPTTTLPRHFTPGLGNRLDYAILPAFTDLNQQTPILRF